MRIRWTELAQRDFTSICDYTEEQNGPAAARRIALRIYEAIDLWHSFQPVAVRVANPTHVS